MKPEGDGADSPTRAQKNSRAVKRRGYFFAAKRLARRNFASQNSMKNEE
jgi:hypothetical protein